MYPLPLLSAATAVDMATTTVTTAVTAVATAVAMVVAFTMVMAVTVAAVTKRWRQQPWQWAKSIIN
jgi:hypothetical protein